MRDLTQHLTTRADDNHAPPVSAFPEGHLMYLYFVSRMSRPGRFFALLRIKPHNPPLVRPPSIPLSFNLAIVLPRWDTYCVNCGTQGVSPRTPSIHRLQRGLPGYLILFAPHAFAPHRQLSSSNPPSPLVFLLISTHFTATQGIPITSPALKTYSFKCSFRVKP